MRLVCPVIRIKSERLICGARYIDIWQGAYWSYPIQGCLSFFFPTGLYLISFYPSLLYSGILCFTILPYHLSTLLIFHPSVPYQNLAELTIHIIYIYRPIDPPKRRYCSKARIFPDWLRYWRSDCRNYNIQNFMHITKICLYNFDPLKPHFYIVKLGFTRV